MGQSLTTLLQSVLSFFCTKQNQKKEPHRVIEPWLDKGNFPIMCALPSTLSKQQQLFPTNKRQGTNLQPQGPVTLFFPLSTIHSFDAKTFQFSLWKKLLTMQHTHTHQTTVKILQILIFRSENWKYEQPNVQLKQTRSTLESNAWQSQLEKQRKIIIMFLLNLSATFRANQVVRDGCNPSELTHHQASPWDSLLLLVWPPWLTVERSPAFYNHTSWCCQGARKRKK